MSSLLVSVRGGVDRARGGGVSLVVTMGDAVVDAEMIVFLRPAPSRLLSRESRAFCYFVCCPSQSSELAANCWDGRWWNVDVDVS